MQKKKIYKNLIFLVVLFLGSLLVVAINEINSNTFTAENVQGNIDCSNVTGTRKDTCDLLNQGNRLGTVKMLDVSRAGSATIAEVQSRGWAVADGTTPSTQGISGANITSTPNLVDKFIRGDASASGTTGGSATHTNPLSSYVTSNSPTSGTEEWWIHEASNLPPYYEVVYIIKVKE